MQKGMRTAKWHQPKEPTIGKKVKKNAKIKQRRPRVGGTRVLKSPEIDPEGDAYL